MKKLLTIVFLLCAIIVNAQTFLIPLGKNTEWCLHNLSINDYTKVNQKTSIITIKYETYTAFYLIDIERNVCFSVIIKSITKEQHKSFIKDLNFKTKRINHLWHLTNIHGATILVMESKKLLSLTYVSNY